MIFNTMKPNEGLHIAHDSKQTHLKCKSLEADLENILRKAWLWHMQKNHDSSYLKKASKLLDGTCKLFDKLENVD